MESIDFTGLAARAVAGLHEVRACLLVSRDGLTLAAVPEGGEDLARRALDRLDTVGRPERGFLVIGDEVWVVSRRGPYLGIIVAAASARAGLLLDRLESTLRAAEEARLHAGSAGPGRPEIPRRPRTPLHRDRSEMKPNPLFEEVARVVSVPEKETQRSEPSVGEAAATTAWPRTIREPDAPTIGGPGSGTEPPTIVRPAREPEPEPEEPKDVAPEPQPKPDEEEVVASEPEPEPEEEEVVAPEPEPEPEVVAQQPEVVAEQPEEDEANVLAPDTIGEMLEIASLETEFKTSVPEQQEVSSLVPEQALEEPTAPAAEVESELAEPTVSAPAAEESKLEEQPEPAEPELTTPEPVEEPKILAPESEIEMPQVDIDQELPHFVRPEPQPSAFNVDSPRLEPEAPILESELDVMKAEAAAAEPSQELKEEEPARADEAPAVSGPDVGPLPPQRLAHPQIEPPKATPHYSPPDALLGEMGRVVAGESSPADILPPGVSPAKTPEAPADAAEKEDEPAGAKAREASKERAEDTEVDPVALAREFSQLFDEPERNS
jgi:hypothetical protein